MQAKPLLSDDERDYIQQILGKSLSSSALVSPAFRVDGGPAANALLSSLGKNATLHLDAHFGDEYLRFPLQLVEDEFHALHLELGAPQIFQLGRIERPWRVRFEQPMRLINADGQNSDFRLHEMSAGGALIESTAGQELPEHFCLWLPVNQHEPILLKGRRVRNSDQQLTAFRFEQTSSAHHERLRQFIFQQHRLRNQDQEQSSA